MHKGLYKTHCKRGHEYTPKNTVWNLQPGGKRTRKCRRCAYDWKKLHRPARPRRISAEERNRLKAHVQMERDAHYHGRLRDSDFGSGEQIAQ